jgi:hypothetical protein
MLSDDVRVLADDDWEGNPKADDNSDCDGDDDDVDDDGSLEVVGVKADADDAAVAATTRAVTDVETNFIFIC